LRWRKREVSWFKDGSQSKEHNAAIWNGKKANNVAFKTELPTGHMYASIDRKKYLAHRVIWKMAYGFDPGVIDHIDGNPRNNKLGNLRSVTQFENGKNARIRKNNTSGMMGVRWDVRLCKWTAVVSVNYKTIHLGLYNCFGQAVKARKAAERTYAFHPNHGRAI